MHGVKESSSKGDGVSCDKSSSSKEGDGVSSGKGSKESSGHGGVKHVTFAEPEGGNSSRGQRARQILVIVPTAVRLVVRIVEIVIPQSQPLQIVLPGVVTLVVPVLML